VITEAIFRVFWSVAGFIDLLIPPIPWPSFLDSVADFWFSVNVGTDLTGFFMFVHPVTYDVVALAILLRATLAIVQRLRQVVSVSTGGGIGS